MAYTKLATTPAWTAAGHKRGPRVLVSRSIFALVNDRDRAYFGRDRSSDQLGVIANMQHVFGRSYAAEPDKLVEELRMDAAIAAADTLLLTVPNQLGVEYNSHLIEAILGAQMGCHSQCLRPTNADRFLGTGSEQHLPGLRFLHFLLECVGPLGLRVGIVKHCSV
jgi:hypothetical protein